MIYVSFLEHAFSTETAGAWVDENENDRPDAGEGASLNVVVANAGTVTLEALKVLDSINSAGCTASGTFLLEQGEKYECVPVQQVSSVANQTVFARIQAATRTKDLDRNSLDKSRLG